MVGSLRLHDGLGGALTGYRICVTVDDPPLTILTPEDGRDAKRNLCQVICSADLDPGPLDLNHVCEVCTRIARAALRQSMSAERTVSSDTLGLSLQFGRANDLARQRRRHAQRGRRPLHARVMRSPSRGGRVIAP
jgi:hypothetical protein